MELKEIRRLADALGIPGAKQSGIRDVIQSIHVQEGLMPCYSEAWSAPCRIAECPCSSMCSSQPENRTGLKH